MAEYIKREALLKWFEPYLGVGETWVEIHPVLDAIYALSVADVSPVVHGWWTYNGYDAVCSHCGFKWFASCQECAVWPDAVNYCPNCGARMDGE